ncbi:MAG: T9SS type A sorting domain-containing protein [Aureispira sp.]|nr:T9SS type A sorting domain-containing protein [Aureispira sp.]
MKALLTLLFLTTGIFAANATHFFATDLSYQCLGNNQYKVILRLYSDCSGSPPPNTANIYLKSNNCGQSPTSITLNMDMAASGAETTPLCSTYSGMSACKGGGIPSEQESVYTGIITLSQACSDWIISHSYLRSSYFTNLNSPGSSSTYVEATLDNSNGNCYNSPQFTDYPMHYACAGAAFQDNLGARDMNGDTLMYTLIAPATSGSSQASFVAGLSVNNPMQLAASGGLVFNNYNGDISFTPQAGSSQYVALAVKVDKIHNGQIVASSMQEMDIIVTNSCSNPSIRLLDHEVTMGSYSGDTTRVLPICNPATLVAISFELFNPNGDSILYNPAQSNLESVFGVGNFNTNMIYLNNRPDSVRFDITASDYTNPNPTFLSLAVRDKGCVMESHRKFTFLVKPIVQLEYQTTPASTVSSTDGSATINVTQGQPNYSYLWSNGNTTASLSNVVAGTYVVTVTDMNGCIVSDSVEIEVATGLAPIKDVFYSDIQVYPNPAKNYCTVELPSLVADAVEVQLTNALGQTILQQNIELNRKKQFELNTQVYPQGLYWLKVRNSRQEYWIKSLLILK